jgi:hypothetical protein
MKPKQQQTKTAEQTRYKPWISPAVPPVLTSPSRSLGFAALAIFLAGFAFEFEYFRELSLRSFDYLGPAHFFMSGLLIVGFPFAFVMIWAMVMKLFTRAIAEDDWTNVRESYKDSSFAEEVWCARGAVLLALALYVCVHFNMMGVTYTYWMFGVSLLFARTALLAPEPARFALVFWFFVSWMLCAAAGGIYEARAAKEQILVRDDAVSKIERRADHYIVTAKPQVWTPSLPWSMLRGFLGQGTP